MKRKVFVSLFMLLIFSVPTFATDATDFLTCLYSNEQSQIVKIKSYREHTNVCEQELAGKQISAIVYGQASLKIKKQRKQKVSYICLKDCENEFFWGFIIPR